ncbi:polyprenyl synthetase family protein [Streptomyces sp. NPDC052701]|uniref:polyprenyl synthetase family protein n=1 Tax=Streptomyces sp. NPDC052701 TaxID=3155533 RepID=UPI003413870F
MRPTQAKDHPAADPPSVPRLVSLPGSTGRVRPNGAADGPPAAAAVAGPAPLPPGIGDAHAVDEDADAAVGRVLGHVLTERLDRARAVDPLFAQDLAERVARFTERGGRRMRARLVWGALRACGGGDASAAAALRIGAALELVQTCALVHDDLMDGSALRRGRPALHTDVAAQYAGAAPPPGAGRFGSAAAILAGDLALAWADDVVAETVLPPGAATTVRRLWSDLRTEMVAGQYLDVHGQATASRSLPRALRTACLKSALYSVERPLALGAVLAGADDATLRALCSAGRCVGMAFQLRDDLDDVFCDPRRTGKPSGGDVREGKPTYLAALARARAEAAGDRDALAVLDRSLGRAELPEAGLEQVRDVLVRTGARDAVEARIGRLVTQGLRHFDGALLDPGGGRRLRRLLVSAAAGPRAAAGDAHAPAAAPDASVPLPASHDRGSRDTGAHDPGPRRLDPCDPTPRDRAPRDKETLR